MKKCTLTILLLVFASASFAQKMKTKSIETRLQEIEDRIAIKNVVDTFSVLADRKDIANQVLLFTENDTVTSRSAGQPGNTLTGRKQIGDAFSAYLANFETVYHINGQQTITLNGDKATGISYCSVVLIGTQDGKKMKTSMGVYYNDEFVKQNGKWLIASRTSNFEFRETLPFVQ